jgi:hypothetical protein
MRTPRSSGDIDIVDHVAEGTDLLHFAGGGSFDNAGGDVGGDLGDDELLGDGAVDVVVVDSADGAGSVVESAGEGGADADADAGADAGADDNANVDDADDYAADDAGAADAGAGVSTATEDLINF